MKFLEKKIIKRDYFVSSDRRWAAINCEDFGRKFAEDGSLFLAQKNQGKPLKIRENTKILITKRLFF